MSPFLLIPLPWLLLSAGFIGYGVLCAIGERLFLARAEHASGRVVTVHTRTWTTRSSSGHRRVRQHGEYLPEVEFVVEGVRYTVTPPQGMRSNPWSAGDELPVAYDAAMPSRARVVGYAFQYARAMRHMKWGLFLGAVGLVCLVSVLNAIS